MKLNTPYHANLEQKVMSETIRAGITLGCAIVP